MKVADEYYDLLQAVDTACWCLSVRQNTKQRQRCKVDWESSLRDLQDAWQEFKLRMEDRELVESASPSSIANTEEK